MKKVRCCAQLLCRHWADGNPGTLAHIQRCSGQGMTSVWPEGIPENLARERSDCNHIPAFFLIPHSSSFLAFFRLLHGSGSLWMWSGRWFLLESHGSHEVTHGMAAWPGSKPHSIASDLICETLRNSAKLKVLEGTATEAAPLRALCTSLARCSAPDTTEANGRSLPLYSVLGS